MLKWILSVLFVLSFVVVARADLSAAEKAKIEAEQNLESLQKDRASLQLELRAIELSYTNILTQTSRLNRQVEEKRESIQSAASNGDSVSALAVDLDRLNADYRDSSKKLSELNKQRQDLWNKTAQKISEERAASRDVKKASDSVADLKEQLTEQKKQIAEQKNLMKQALLNSSLEAKLSSIENLKNNVRDALNTVERKYDQTVLGLYMRAKMEDLVNSPEFCQAKENCGKKSSPVDLKNLFKSGVSESVPVRKYSAPTSSSKSGTK